ncbi:MAG: type III-A CRISPR-associated RAMP protein Csm4 [Anaerolineae bacterium]|nr:type III-A CRISPR-associated RAMP protein Csm4 [Anaerolineae bacterium]
MPGLIPYHLSFPHGLHVGRGVESLDETLSYVPSDTLFAALLDTWNILGRDVKDLLAGENAEPAFRVTSAFPFAGQVRFYPMPVDLRAVFSQTVLKNEGAGKTIKKIRYLSEGLLQKALKSGKLDEYLFEKENKKPGKGLGIQNGALWLTEEEIQALPNTIREPKDKKGNRSPRALWVQKVWAMQTISRVTLDRISSTPNLFQAARTVFTDDCGLWFGATGQVEKLPTILPVLGENGLGGERTAGYGAFSYEEGKHCPDFPSPQPNERAYLLSRYHPRKEEVALLQADSTVYRLETVRGWLRTPDKAAVQRRKPVLMVAEGSLLSGKPQGNAPDVKPEYDAKNGEKISHPIYRSGFAVFLGWKGGSDA